MNETHCASKRNSWKPRTVALLVALALLGVAADGAAAAVAPPKQESKPAAGVTVVDINTADATALTGVPGIGKATAQRIVEFRETHGRFESVDDLLKVKGIGERSLQKLRPHLKVGKKG